MSTKTKNKPLPVEWDDSHEVLAKVTASGLRASEAAHNVFDSLQAGRITLADATELSNAIGKANGADSNVVKAVMTKMLLNKLEISSAEKQLALEE